MRDQHTHLCHACGRVWTCSNPGCWPADDECRECEQRLAEDWWQAVEAARERDEQRQPRLEF